VTSPDPSAAPDPIAAVNQNITRLRSTLMEIKDILLYGARAARSHPNPLNGFGRKMFSQTDEDGITFEILRRIGIPKGVFAEFGVGDGLENNTLALAAAGWKGFWAGGQDLLIDPNPQRVAQPKFAFIKTWIRKNNAVALFRKGLAQIAAETVDYLSIDLDGTDYYIAEELLAHGITPKIVVVEFNAKFAPPLEWKMDYSDEYFWKGDDYFGASIATFAKLFAHHGYFLACCNAFTGANAFFVQNGYRDQFKDVPEDISQIWCEPQYYLPARYGHRSSPQTVQQILRDLNA
jgi:hypothetical protein